jgi:hypothetical protein
VLLVLAWVGSVYRWLAHPGLDQPTRADAVIVLGPPEENGSLALGESLVGRGLAPQLLVSIAAGQRGPVGHICAGDRPAPVARFACFVPDPTTTRGEAREVARLVGRNGWHTVIVVTSVYHVQRSRMVFDRCYSGRLEMVAPPTEISASRWAYEAVYQSAAFLEASLQGGC